MSEAKRGKWKAKNGGAKKPPVASGQSAVVGSDVSRSDPQTAAQNPFSMPSLDDLGLTVPANVPDTAVEGLDVPDVPSRPLAEDMAETARIRNGTTPVLPLAAGMTPFPDPAGTPAPASAVTPAQAPVSAPVVTPAPVAPAPAPAPAPASGMSIWKKVWIGVITVCVIVALAITAGVMIGAKFAKAAPAPAAAPVAPKPAPASTPTSGTPSGSGPGTVITSSGVEVNVPIGLRYQVKEEWYYPQDGLRVERVDLGSVSPEGSRRTLATELGSPVVFQAPVTSPLGLSAEALQSEFGKRVDNIDASVTNLRGEVSGIKTDVGKLTAGQEEILKLLTPPSAPAVPAPTSTPVSALTPEQEKAIQELKQRGVNINKLTPVVPSTSPSP